MKHELSRMLILIAVVGLSGAHATDAQYSSQVFDLKRASDLYDARGIDNGRSLTVDGQLVVSNVNGNVTYSYPVSSTTVSGYPLTTTLNYCGSVSCTAYGDWFAGASGTPYSRWNRFHQNRPMWLLGVNGFAIQALAHATTYHSQLGRFPDDRNDYDDRDFVWTIDGYDVCNRMERIASTNGTAPSYVDVIRLLRADGGILELVNHKTAIPNTPEITRPDLYTGYYVVNEANSPAYGVVEFDSTYWPEYVRRHAPLTGPVFPFVPRLLRYYPGDGMEYRFREWIIPFGTRAYDGDGLDRPDRFGGMWAGPTVFYLESIESASGTVTTFTRSRHIYPRERVTLRGGSIFDPVLDSTLDSTRGRALTTGYRGHRITYGDGAMVIEALGRTIRVRFDTVSRSGDASDDGPIPLATRGYLTATSGALANVPEVGTGGTSIYGSWAAYVTEIVDPDGRKTRFHYQPYQRRFVNFGFPHANPPGNLQQGVSLNNYRLIGIDEPTCRYELEYACSSPLMTPVTPPATPDTTIYAGAYPGEQPYWTNNVVRLVSRFDLSGRLQTTSQREYDYDLTTGGFIHSRETVLDEIDGTVRTQDEYYRSRIIDNGPPNAPEPRYTENYLSVTTGADTISTLRGYDSIVPGGHLWLPTSEMTYVNGLLRAKREFAYQTGCVRLFGGDTALAHRYGHDVNRRVERLRHPLHGGLIALDTFDFIHVPLLDTLLTRRDSFLLKFESLDRYRSLVGAGVVVGTWEEAMRDPRVAVYDIEERQVHVWLPPISSLERRHVTADGTGTIVSGEARDWSFGSGSYLTDRLFRGRAVGDTLIGAGGVLSVLKSATAFSRLWGADRPEVTTNANGATTRFYLESYSSPSLRDATGSYVPRASIVRNDASRVDTILPHGGYFADMYDKPLAREDYVRRYRSNGQLVTDSLLTMSGFTFGGIPSISVDPNRVASRYAYDPSMRLSRAWLAYDNPAPATGSTYTATRIIDLFGETRYVSYTDTLHCTASDSTIVEGEELIVARDGLYAATPVPSPPPPCPCHTQSGKQAETRNLAANCSAPIPFTNRRSYVGALSLVITTGSPLLDAVSLSGAWLQFNVGATSGRCMPLRVRIPRLSIDRTYLLNCIEEGVAWIPDSVQSPGGATLAETYSMRVDLSDALGALVSLGAGEEVEVTLEAPGLGTSAAFVAGMDAEDARPRLVLTGQFRTPDADDDFTIAFLNGDSTQTSTVRAKVDDPRTSANRVATRRVAEVFNRFGTDGRVVTVREDDDSTCRRYSGLGSLLSETDEEGDSLVHGRDSDGRERETIHPGGAIERTSYVTGLPSSFGIADQDFIGFCRAKYETDERGVVTATYSDALDRIRRIVVDTALLRLTTRMDYDVLGRITTSISPGGDTTSYVYDPFGRIRAKSHPDFGVQSFGYDAVGNLRFSQTQDQANHRRLTYHEYDDLNRLVLVGEAEIEDEGGGDHPIDEIKRENDGGLLGTGQLTGRLSDLPATLLRDGGASAIVTASKTIWMQPTYGVPRIASDAQMKIEQTTVPPDPVHGDPVGYNGPAVVLPPPIVPASPRPKATINDFEHHARYPHFPRMAVSYDRLPESSGPVWGAFPPSAVWDSLAPTGKVRNLLQHEAAVAWREGPDQAYHYSVMSYDDRGRPEGIFRRNEGLGYEALYFTFNAMNQITRVVVADPINVSYIWIGRDSHGRIDSIWARTVPGGGIARNGFTALQRPPLPPARPDDAVVAYTYTRDGLPAQQSMPQIGAWIAWSYNSRRWLDSMVATVGGPTNLFAEHLQYDEAGRVQSESVEQGTGAARVQMYIHDNANRLTDWGGGNSSNNTSYLYDNDGNRSAAWRPDPVDGTIQETTTLVGPGPGSNRLGEIRSTTLGGVGRGVTTYTSDPDGAITGESNFDANGNATRSITYAYNYREVVTGAVVSTPAAIDSWTYRYAPNGEREMKLQTLASTTGSPTRVAWNVLGVGHQQLGRWSGVIAVSPQPNIPAGSRVMYPVETSVAGIVGTVGTMSPVGAYTYVVADHLGSTRATIDASGLVTSRVDYDPFGAEHVVVGNAPRNGFAGRELDRETGLIDMGVRKYAPREGRFLSVDPAWEMFRSLMPYQYAQLDPLRRIDPNGMWDIIVVASKDRANNPIATAYLVDRNGNVKYTFQVKVVGQHRDRMKTAGDTPFGTYAISQRSPWLSGGRKAFGPHPRLALDGESGEARASGRSLIRLHGGRQEELVRQPGSSSRTWVRKKNTGLSNLPPTRGCIRAMDDVMRQLYQRTQQMEATSSEERPGHVYVVSPEEFQRRFPKVSTGQ